MEGFFIDQITGNNIMVLKGIRDMNSYFSLSRAASKEISTPGNTVRFVPLAAD